MGRPKKEVEVKEETKEVKKASKKETAVAKIAKVDEDKHKKFREAHEKKFFVIKDIDLAEIIIAEFKDEGLNKAQLCRLFGWETARVEICFNCSKTASQSLKLGTEKDFINHLVKLDKLPEGNYMVLVT